MSHAQVVFLAGGKGTRLQPYTAVIPKPLVPVGHLPILEVLIRQVRHYGFTRIALAVSHLEHLVRAYFGTGSRWGVHIEYLKEERPLGTAGVLGTLRHLHGPVLLINGDILTTLNFQRLVAQHQQRRHLMTLAICRRQVPITFGVVEVDAQQRLRQYREKPQLAYWVSSGIVVVSPRVTTLIRRGERVDLPELVRRALVRGESVGTVPLRGFWLDIGRPDDYSTAQRLLERQPRRFLPRERR